MRASTSSRSSSPLARSDLAGYNPPAKRRAPASPSIRESPKPKSRHSRCTEPPAPAPKPSLTRKPPPIVSRPPAPSHSATPSPLRPSTPLNNEAAPQRYITPFAKSHRRAFSLLTPSPSIASLASASASTGPAPDSPCSSRTPTTPLRSIHFLPPVALTPPRPTPTLAMSVQVHSPFLDTRPLPLPSSPRARASSPPPRPPSRSERLLRDTLRRADAHAHERAYPSPHHPHTAVRRSESYTGPCGGPGEFTDGECEFDDEYWMRGAMLFKPPVSQHAQLPSRPTHRSTHSVPNIPRRGRQPRDDDTSLSSSPSPASGSGASTRSQMLAPHGAALRSQLENVLRGAQLRDVDDRRGLGHARRRSLDREREWAWSSPEQSSSDVSSPDSSSRTPGATPSPPSRPSPTSSTYGALPVISSGSSSGSRSIPLTPPPSPPFNVQSAAAKLRAMDGYVSFANVEGLGLPPGMDGDDEGEGEEGGPRSGIRGWWKAAFSARSRSGSASAGAGAMPSRRDA